MTTNKGDSNTGSVRLIMIADDDKDDIFIIEEAFQAIDPSIKVETVSNGNALCNLLSHILPDLLFLDLDMPEKNGLQCLNEIRSNTITENLPIIVYSSTSRPANISAAYDMGADLFFIKPFDYVSLSQSLSAILKLDWSGPKKIKEQYFINGRYTAFL